MYYLAVDIGASSGRHILGKFENGKVELKEIYRFENGAEKDGNKLVWNVEKLYANIIAGIKECNKLGVTPYSVGIDTWGVDYALLDENNEIIGEVYSYRDSRTSDMTEKSQELVSFSELYERTGIQHAVFNTVYQLYADKLSGKLQKAKKFLTVPDYMHYRLSGVMVNEYTDASTTALVNAKTRNWDYELIEKYGFDKDIFQKIVEPGTVLGRFTEEVKNEVGFDAYVVVPATHDTGSAVMAVPAISENPLYISSGTWSLLGTELKEPITNEKAFNFNMTNEGGFEKTIRFLKNISGMWTIQSIKKELQGKYSYDDLMYMAIDVGDFGSIVDINDERFLAPESMINAVKSYCVDYNLKVPETIGEVMNVVYRSIASVYAKTIKSLEKITGVNYPILNIVGGGSKDGYLNRLAKEYTGKKVLVGPTEGTAVGNLLAQAISSKEIKDLKEGRQVVINSFGIKEI
ncbi:MAG: rhamnulokinase [Clostridia bacterium]|nr:rhamnulokinase [Clostridia bacterium]